jgi:hypothetical protein
MDRARAAAAHRSDDETDGNARDGRKKRKWVSRCADRRPIGDVVKTNKNPRAGGPTAGFDYLESDMVDSEMGP